MDWSPDGTRLAAIKYETQFVSNTEQHISMSEHDSFLVILDAKTLEEVAQLTEPVHNAMDPFLWSPDGGRIAILHPDKIEVIDAQTGASLEQVATENYNLNAAWSPFGGRLAIAEVSDQTVTQQASNSNAQEIQFVVPAPSPALLDSIEGKCVPAKMISKLPVAETLTANSNTTEAYVAAVQADKTIPASCAADLIEVAQALQAEGQGR